MNVLLVRSHGGGRVDGILSICGPEVSRGSLLVGSRRAQAPRPHARRLPSVYTYQYRCLTLRTCTMIPPNFHPELSGESRARAHAVSATTRPQTYPGGSPRADLHAKKGNNLVPMAPHPRQIRNYPRAPSSRHSGLVGPHTTPPIVNYKYMTSTPREGYFGAAHARDVNIFIWTSRKSVGHAGYMSSRKARVRRGICRCMSPEE